MNTRNYFETFWVFILKLSNELCNHTARELNVTCSSTHQRDSNFSNVTDVRQQRQKVSNFELIITNKSIILMLTSYRVRRRWSKNIKFIPHRFDIKEMTASALSQRHPHQMN